MTYTCAADEPKLLCLSSHLALVVVIFQASRQLVMQHPKRSDTQAASAELDREIAATAADDQAAADAIQVWVWGGRLDWGIVHLDYSNPARPLADCDAAEVLSSRASLEGHLS